MIEKFVLGETGTGDLLILSPTRYPLRHPDTLLLLFWMMMMVVALDLLPSTSSLLVILLLLLLLLAVVVVVVVVVEDDDAIVDCWRVDVVTFAVKFCVVVAGIAVAVPAIVIGYIDCWWLLPY